MTPALEQPKVSALAPWFGSARMIAERVGLAMKGCKWVGIPFAGGMPEVAHITASTIVVNDMHSQIINLASVARCPLAGPKLYRQLKRIPFAQESLKAAQTACREWQRISDAPDLQGAVNYFVACWMGRSGISGIDDEFCGKISIRWNGNGGDSNTRYRSAVRSLMTWRRVLVRVNLTCGDAFDFLAKCQDDPKHGIYCDPPWIEDGERYRHRFSNDDHGRLSRVLEKFAYARVVLRVGIHPLMEELYPREKWSWDEYDSRTQGNNDKAEVLITRRNAQGSLLI